MSLGVGDHLQFALAGLYRLARVPFVQGNGFGDIQALFDAVEQWLQLAGRWRCRCATLGEKQGSEQQGKQGCAHGEVS
ncbi:hypothetical protein D3C84_898700 [compost metagenome]